MIVDGQKNRGSDGCLRGRVEIQRTASASRTVSLKDLIALRYLNAADVSGLKGLEVTVNLQADPTRPQDVLIRAQLPGGEEMVTFVDGTVQQIPAATSAR